MKNNTTVISIALIVSCLVLIVNTLNRRLWNIDALTVICGIVSMINLVVIVFTFVKLVKNNKK